MVLVVKTMRHRLLEVKVRLHLLLAHHLFQQLRPLEVVAAVEAQTYLGVRVVQVVAEVDFPPTQAVLEIHHQPRLLKETMEGIRQQVPWPVLAVVALEPLVSRRRPPQAAQVGRVLHLL